jgi:hypothetical protein
MVNIRLIVMERMARRPEPTRLRLDDASCDSVPVLTIHG